jgi:hypothetical protein
MTTALAPVTMTRAVNKVVQEIEFLGNTQDKAMLGPDVLMHIQDLCCELQCLPEQLPSALQMMAEVARQRPEQIFDRSKAIQTFRAAAAHLHT